MNNPQQQAIEKTEGPCLIMAGAGTGKTYTIIKKISHLVENEICKPSEILCLTFSNEATNNMKSELLKELKKASDITVNTFHSFCADILREFGHLIKIDPGFELLLPDDARIMFHKYIGVTPYYANRYVATISTAKDFGISLEKLEEYTNNLKKNFKNIKDIDKCAEELDLELNTLHLNPSDTIEERRKTRERKKEITEFIKKYQEYIKFQNFVEAWKKYEELKKDKNYQDYSDLNANVLQLFNKFDMDEIKDRFKYVVIDEFQDTNKLQFELIEHLAKNHKNITIVGDQNQSIYGFRGAYKESFNHFKEVFNVDEKQDIFNLNKSYRSPNKILKISYDLIKSNYNNPEECFLVKNFEDKEGSDITVYELKNFEEEARKVAELVEENIEEGVPFNEICVLYRTHKQGRLIRQAIESKNIPVISAGKTDLMQKPEIKTVIAYLSILNNLTERTGTGEQAWWDLFHYHNSLAPEDSIKIGRYLKSKREDDISIDFVLLNHLEKINLSSEGKKVIKRVVSKLNELVKISNKHLPDLILDIYELTGLNRAFTHQRSVRNIESLMNLKQFYDIAESFYKMHEKSLSSFIKYLEILDDLGVNVDASKVNDINAIRLMTIHAVKGLQFNKVIVTNLSEGRFPVERTRNEPLIPKEFLPDLNRYLDSLNITDEKKIIEAIKDYERETLLYEERRLCYVAFTRAKQDLVLTFTTADEETNSTGPSIFLNEIAFNDNKDIKVIQDFEEKCTIFAPCSKYEQFKSLLKNQFIEALDTDDIDSLLSRLATYHAVREGEIFDYSKINWDKIIDRKELQNHIKMTNGKCSCLKFDHDNFTFSPTALLTYDECPKKYELQSIFQMPERGAFEWSGASVGSFIHKLLEEGVKSGFKSKEEFIKRAKEMSNLSDWKEIDLVEVKKLIDIFWERHKGRYNEKSLVEQKLSFELGGFRFFGIADRIDFIKDKNIEVIDYKTNKSSIEPKKRAWQLGFYAIATKKQLNLNPVKLTLEMLRLEKPIETEVDKEGNVKAGRSKGFNIKEVEDELVDCAKKIVKDYEGEFLPTEDENKCRFCGYKFYCPKWEEK